jgi:hypothetical protein
MKTKNYERTFTVKKTPKEVHDAICRVKDWWTINTDGRATAVGDEFTVDFPGIHRTTQRVTELVPGERITWRVTRSRLTFIKDQKEWKGTDIVFDIAATANGTRLTMTHVGLSPSVECYAQCSKGWDYFFGVSLFKLLATGKGQPDTEKLPQRERVK